MAFIIMTHSITTLSIMDLIVTLSIKLKHYIKLKH
jgi:hypothetical protein